MLTDTTQDSFNNFAFTLFSSFNRNIFSTFWTNFPKIKYNLLNIMDPVDTMSMIQQCVSCSTKWFVDKIGLFAIIFFQYNYGLFVLNDLTYYRDQLHIR